ncbi:hypothetical protein [Streptomyces sp. NBC_01601]|uniref:hypothetical protein n=1 Tax=Streptomyces sp. NBC_01601 TaxID=2975892 RepID=UPI002E2C02D0|nr:hypothetical protein [Streptomyces sp. NBC_01601]
MRNSSELLDVELTTEELADVLGSGNTVDVFFGNVFVFQVSLSGVAVHTRRELLPNEVTTLAEGLAEGSIVLNPSPRAETPVCVDPGQVALLDRVLTARRRLIGT